MILSPRYKCVLVGMVPGVLLLSVCSPWVRHSYGEDDPKKVASKIRVLLRRLPTAKGKALEDIGQQFVDMDGQGVDVKRPLCKALGASLTLKSSENTLVALERLSPDLAGQARSLLATDAVGPIAQFEHCGTAFKKLSALIPKKKLNASISPLVVSTLMRLKMVENMAGSDRRLSDIKYDVYSAGVEVVGGLAREDDGAFEDLMTLLEASGPRYDVMAPFRSSVLRHIASAVGKDAKRAKIAVPALTQILKAAVSSIQVGRPDASVRKLLHVFTGASVLDALGEIGPNSASAIPLIRQLQNHPDFRISAQNALKKIEK